MRSELFYLFNLVAFLNLFILLTISPLIEANASFTCELSGNFTKADFNVFRLDKRETYINLREHLIPSEVYINGKKIISSQKSEQI